MGATSDTVVWVKEATQKLEALGRLQPGWDSHGGMPLRPEAKELAIRVLENLRGYGLQVPGVVLGSNGNVHLEWHVGGKELELELGGGSAIDFVTVSREGEIEEGTVDFSDNQALGSLLRWLTLE